MNLSDWARNEIAIAIQKEHPGYDDSRDGFDYGVMCYKSALKAFESLMKDDHSGYSIQITKSILDRLIDGKPLTPITDKDFDVPDRIRDIHDGMESIQCPRMSSLSRR